MKDQLAQVVRDIPPSPIREMFTAAEAYDDVISLGIGEPDFNTPTEVCRNALADAEAGHTHYTASQGDPELLSALAGYLNQLYQIELAPADILITVGGIGALTTFFRAVCNPGDEVIVPEPHFPAYLANIEFGGGKMVHAHTDFKDGFVLKPEAVEAAITPKSKALLLNSPNNPTGAMIPGPVLDQLADLAIKHDLLVVSDEVYNTIVFGEVAHESIYTRKGMAERTCVVGSFSKAFAMTGWRLGWIFGPEWLKAGMLKVATFYTSCPPSVSQRAALAALKQPPLQFEQMVEAFHQRRDLTCAALESIPGLKFHRPAGSFYVFPDISAVTSDSERFAWDLLEQQQVVVIPGQGFGPSGAGCVRIACTVDEERLAVALDRFKKFAASYRK
jgi:aspartate/methionine/tyrosine aminotransferase